MSSCRHKTISGARAFTLIELVLAAALAATFSVAVLGTLTRIPRRREHMPRQPAWRESESALLSVVEMDLLNASGIRARPSGISLKGFCRLDAERKRVVHLPATVTYEVGAAAGQSWLLRRQSFLDPAGVPRRQTDLVCHGVKKIAVVAGDSGEAGPVSPAARRWQPVPAAVTVTLTLGKPGSEEDRQVRRLLCLR